MVTRCLPSSTEMLRELLSSSVFPCKGLHIARYAPRGRLRLLALQRTSGERGKKETSVSVVTTVLAAAWCGYNPRVELLCKMHVGRGEWII